MRKKMNCEKVTFLGGFGGETPKKKEIRSLQLLCSNFHFSLLTLSSLLVPSNLWGTSLNPIVPGPISNRINWVQGFYIGIVHYEGFRFWNVLNRSVRCDYHSPFRGS